MEIYECRHKVKCDFAGCGKVAKYSLVKRGLLRRDINFCDECLSEIARLAGKVKAPRAVKSPFKLNKRLEEK